ncbi:S-adenosylmethionine decarboxylase [Pelagibacter phage Eistla EXVC025P]|nr:S-adenosylmethionine decarboxylase [Pelagibacter phage Eistla EXVC025P]
MLEHKHIIIRATVKKPPVQVDVIKQWVRNLVEKLNMKPLGDTVSVYVDKKGNRGLTCLQAIETSHIAFHSWDEDKPAVVQLDVYTCSHLNKQTVFDALEKFEPIKINYLTLDREKYLNIIHI